MQCRPKAESEALV